MLTAEGSSSQGVLLEDVFAFPNVEGKIATPEAPAPSGGFGYSTVRLTFGCEEKETGEIFRWGWGSCRLRGALSCVTEGVGWGLAGRQAERGEWQSNTLGCACHAMRQNLGAWGLDLSTLCRCHACAQRRQVADGVMGMGDNSNTIQSQVRFLYARSGTGARVACASRCISSFAPAAAAAGSFCSTLERCACVCCCTFVDPIEAQPLSLLTLLATMRPATQLVRLGLIDDTFSLCLGYPSGGIMLLGAWVGHARHPLMEC